MSFHLWSDPPTPRASRRNIRDVMLRLFVGMPIRDYHRVTGSTFWRSGKAVKRKPSLNPCREWPGWSKLAWRLLLYPALPFWWNPLKYWDPKYRGIPAHEMAWVSAGLSAAAFCVFLYVFNRRTSKRKSVPSSVPYEIIPDDGDIARVPIGQTEGKKWVRLDLVKEPHVAVSTPTNYGKTSFLYNFILWVWLRGAKVWVIDPKISSFMAFRKAHNVELPLRPEWPTTVRKFYESMYGFYTAQFNDDTETMERYKREWNFLVIDEMATFVDLMKEDEGNDSPTLKLVKQILHLGRAANHQIVIAVHQANKTALLSTDARSQLHNRIALGPQDRESWQTLFQDLRMKVRKKQGRGIARIGGEYVELQAVYVSEPQVREIVSNATPPVPPVPGTNALASSPGDMGPNVPGTESNQRDDVSDNETPRIKGLSNGAAFLGMKLDAFRKARQRTAIPGEQRDGNSVSWTELELLTWNRDRKARES